MIEYRKCLKATCKKYRIKHVAEEFSVMALLKYGLQSTDAQNVASESGIEHVLMDPDLNERKSLGIKLREEVARELGIYKDDESYTEDEKNSINQASAKFDRLREEEWLSRAFAEESIGPILFLCGYQHVEHLLKLLKEKGFMVEHISACK